VTALPPLRQRQEDIQILAYYFLKIMFAKTDYSKISLPFTVAQGQMAWQY
jgi:transcriptional regulator with GAF, ATPase, and Fis domain